MPRLLIGIALILASTAAAQADAPYVDSAAIKQRFDKITAADMEALRGKKILFASRSFGLNLRGGLALLSRQNKQYDILGSYERFDVFKAGSDLSVIPADAFEKHNFVHFLATYWPHTKRLEEVDTVMRQPPHEFGEDVDFVVIYFHTALPTIFDTYVKTLDGLQREFPNARVIYTTAGFMAESRKKDNDNSFAFNEKVRERYKSKAPLYDLGKILSDDYAAGQFFAPGYSSDPAGVHPNEDAGEIMMAKGFLLVLVEAMKSQPTEVEQADQPQAGDGPDVETLNPRHREYRAVRAILDRNGLDKKTVESVAVVKDGHVRELYLQEGGIAKLPAAIGLLTELRVLHLYGDRDLEHPLLSQIDPNIARCTKLEELLLNENDLTALPEEITNLKNLRKLSVADNRLNELPKSVRDWLEQHDPEGLKNQRPADD